ncbi:Vacuolar protein 8 [Mortierella sp. GBA30]|nr:Vacuolar protein 8 [Mortierella sp. GBA30]
MTKKKNNRKGSKKGASSCATSQGISSSSSARIDTQQRNNQPEISGLDEGSITLPDLGGLSITDFDTPVAITEEERRAGIYVGDLLERKLAPVEQRTFVFTQRSDVDFFKGEPLNALRKLAFAQAVHLNSLAAGAFAIAMEDEDTVYSRAFGHEVWEPLIQLLKSRNSEIQTLALRAMIGLTFVDVNKLQVVRLGGLEPICRLLRSPNKNVQGNAAACVSNLVEHEGNHAYFIQCQGNAPLVQNARSNDVLIQRYCARSFLGLSKSVIGSQDMIEAGVVPVLVQMLGKPDDNLKISSAHALQGIAKNEDCRKKLTQNETTLAQPLVKLLNYRVAEVSLYAALAMSYMALEKSFSSEFVRLGALKPLVCMAKSTNMNLVTASITCLSGISILTSNKTLIMKSDCLERLVELLDYESYQEVCIPAVATLRNLVQDDKEILNEVLKAGTLDRLSAILPISPADVQLELISFFMALTLESDNVPSEVQLRFPEILVPLTRSVNSDVQLLCGTIIFLAGMLMDDDIMFKLYWTEPTGGIQGYLARFLRSQNPKLHAVALSTLAALLKIGGARWEEMINRSKLIKPLLVRLVKEIVLDPEYQRRADALDDPLDGCSLLMMTGIILAALD